MFRIRGPISFVRFLVFLTMIGFAVTVLIGPAVAVAGTLLPFVLIGGLTWGGYRVAKRVVRRVRGTRFRVVREEFEPAQESAVANSPVPEPEPQPEFEPLLVEEPRPIRKPSRFRSFLRTAGYVTLEVGCGAILGGALSLLAESQFGSIETQRVVLGSIIGAVVGFVVGGSRPNYETDCCDETSDSCSQAA